MGLIPDDRRPRDWAYMVTFDRKDLPSLEEMAWHIRETHDTAMIEDFNLKCEQKLKTGAAELNSGIEIKQVIKSEDLVLNGGLNHCINLILGTVSTRFSHFGIGSGGAIPAITDTALGSEVLAHRITLAWAEPVGMRLFFGGISSQTDGFTPATVVELGVYNGSAAGAVLLNRTQYANTAQRPTQPVAGFSTPQISSAPILVSAVIEFCPVV